MKATKADASIKAGVFSPYFYASGVRPKITAIEFDGEFTTISPHAFYNVGANISGKNGVLYANTAMSGEFLGKNTLTGTIILSDDYKQLHLGPWYDTYLEATVILPSTITSITGYTLMGLNLGENAKIYCGAENCEQIFRNVNCNDLPNEDFIERCKSNLANLLSSGKLLSYPDGCAKMDTSGCTKCKSKNFRLNEGECDRLRYTPAEAAAAMNGDDNTITLTFKK